MTDQNSYLVPVEEMVDAGGEDGHMWAKCSLTELKRAMRNVFENREAVNNLFYIYSNH
jgi:hypothetical protein